MFSHCFVFVFFTHVTLCGFWISPNTTSVLPYTLRSPHQVLFIKENRAETWPLRVRKSIPYWRLYRFGHRYDIFRVPVNTGVLFQVYCYFIYLIHTHTHKISILEHIFIFIFICLVVKVHIIIIYYENLNLNL